MYELGDERKLGRLGEDALIAWAHQVGITVNKATEDERGWDYILEFPVPPRTPTDFHLPLDKAPGLIRCFVQVKSTDGQKRSCSVTLSNWESLVKCPLPAFFLALEFDHNIECQRAFLVHIGEEYIGKALKRLREAGPEDRDNLNKMTMDFSYGEEDLLPSLDGQALRITIMRHVRDSLETYDAWKHKVLETIGYEEGGWHFNVSLRLPDPNADIQDQLVDFSLGLIPSLEVIGGEIRDARFGIEATQPTEVLTGGRIELQRTPVGTGTIVLALQDGSKQLRCDAQVYAPQGLAPGTIEEDRRKLRFATPFIDFLAWSQSVGRFDIGYHFPPSEEKHDLKDLRYLAQLILLFREAFLHSETVDVELLYESTPAAQGHIVASVSPADNAVKMAQAIDSAWTVAKEFDITAGMIVNWAELLRQKEGLDFMAQILTSKRPAMKVGFLLPNESHDIEARVACVPMVVTVAMGQYRITVAVALLGQAKGTGRIYENGHEFLMDVTDTAVCRKHIYGINEGEKYNPQDLIEAVVRSYEQNYEVIVIED
jgi:hypothetical protein